MREGAGTTKAAAGPPRVKRCQRCDYDLMHTHRAGVCPECGLEYDLWVRGTFHVGSPLGPVRRLILATAGRPWMVLVVLALLGWLKLTADPLVTYMFLAVCATLLLAPFILIPCLLRLGLVKWAARGRERVYGRQLRAERRACILGIAGFLTIGFSTIIALPTRALFYPFLPWFNAVADDAEATLTPTTALPTWTPMVRDHQIGLWSVTVEHFDDGIVVFYTSYGGFPGGGAGFVRVPPGAELPGYNEGNDGQLTGRWHYYVTD